MKVFTVSLLIIVQGQSHVGTCTSQNDSRKVENPNNSHRNFDHERSEEVVQKEDFNDWRIVRFYMDTEKTMSDLTDCLGNLTDITVLGVRKGKDPVSKEKMKIEIAIPPLLDLEEKLSGMHLPPICCLDCYATDVGSTNSAMPLKRIDTSLNTGRIRMCPNVEVEGEENNQIEGRADGEMLKWRTIVTDLGKRIRKFETKNLNGTEPLQWDGYYRYNSIVRFVADLADNHSTVDYMKMAKTFNDRYLFAQIFSTNPLDTLRQFTDYLSSDGKKSQERNGHVGNKKESNGSRRAETRERKKRTKKTTKKTKKQEKNNKRTKNKRKRENKRQPKEKVKKKKKKKRKKKKRPYILIEAGAHAREWISPAVGTYIAQQLANAGKSFLKIANFLVVPLANPDGYEYSHTNFRLWRKNRSNTGVGSRCFGVDLNRNWGYKWGQVPGSSSYPCSDQYRGTRRFSEPETFSVRTLGLAFRKNLKLFLTLHCYGQVLLYPWGYADKRAPKHKKLKSMARVLRNNIHNSGFSYYTFGQSAPTLYVASGVADDYMYSIGVPSAFTLELPSLDSFILPETHIVPIAEQVWQGLVCSLGKILGSKKADRFCGKRIITVVAEGEIPLSSWVSKGVPIEMAKVKLLKEYQMKNSKNYRRRLKIDNANKRKRLKRRNIDT